MTGCGCNAKDYSPGLVNSEYRGKTVGHPLVDWPGWGMNDARYSNQTDIMPLPVQPIHFQQWPAMQFQLSNGWQYTNYGQKMAYDDYLRMLTSSNSSPNNAKPMVIPGQGQQPVSFGANSNSLVSQKTIQNTMFVNNESPLPSGFANVGKRTFYG